jgi:hypothetical protein
MEYEDYVPLMDKYPELKLRPTTEFTDHEKIQSFDYVQDLKLKGDKALHGYFYLIVRDGKYGVYMYDPGLFCRTTSVALKPIYDSIEFISETGQSFGAIVVKSGKYGMVFWTYGPIFNDKFEVPAEYDFLEKVDNTRFRAIKNNAVTYFDAAGHKLK